MEGVVIRDMANTDLPSVLVVAQQSFSTPWKINSFKHEIENKEAILKVALSASELVGYVCIRTLLDVTHIMDIAVLSEYRQQGIGSRLLQDALNTLQHTSPDVRQVTLEVRESNSSAIRLYNKHGFSVKGKRKGYYKNPVEDALIMGLDREGL